MNDAAPVPALAEPMRSRLIGPIRREIEREIESALHPKGMSTHDGYGRFQAHHIKRLLDIIDAAPAAEPVAQPDCIAEFDAACKMMARYDRPRDGAVPLAQAIQELAESRGVEPVAQQPPPREPICPKCGELMVCVAVEPAAPQPEAPTLADDPLVRRLRNTPNWLREEYGNWKDATSHYDRAPFEAAARIESDTERIRVLEAENAEIRGRSIRRKAELAASRERERAAYERGAKVCESLCNDQFHAVENRVAMICAKAIRALAAPDSAAEQEREC